MKISFKINLKMMGVPDFCRFLDPLKRIGIAYLRLAICRAENQISISIHEPTLTCMAPHCFGEWVLVLLDEPGVNRYSRDSKRPAWSGNIVVGNLAWVSWPWL